MKIIGFGMQKIAFEYELSDFISAIFKLFLAFICLI